MVDFRANSGDAILNCELNMVSAEPREAFQREILWTKVVQVVSWLKVARAARGP